jgi:hypothetical protein
LTDFSAQSEATEPGSERARFDALPCDVRAIERIVPTLVVHHMEHIYGFAVDPARWAESDVRRVETMLRRMAELDDRPLTAPRLIELRLVGHCRQSTVLAVSMLRHLGYAARARCGFSAYFGAFRGDHWLVEYHDGGRWLLMDAELDEPLMRASDIRFDPCDVPREEWLSAAHVWLACRRGDDDESRYGLDPTDTGLQYVRAQLLRDLAALNRVEVGAGDRWALGARDRVLTTDDLGLLDEIAAAILRDDPAAQARLFADRRCVLDELPPDHVSTLSSASVSSSSGA